MMNSFTTQYVLQKISKIINASDRDEITKLDQILRLSCKFRSQQLSQHLIAENGNIVQTGSFKGMKLIPFGGCFTPKILGSYEAELRTIIKQIISSNYEQLINIGCAEGYYTTGIARAMPNIQVQSYDRNPNARNLCKQMIEKNNVANRVTISDKCSHDDFARFKDKKTIIICDIEGAEIELLDPNKAPELLKMDLLVELHDTNQNTVLQTTEIIISRFNNTHNIEHYETGSRDLLQYKSLKNYSHLDQLLAFWEYRNPPTPWVFMQNKITYDLSL